MKYKNEVIINAPIDKVIELFDDADNLKKWQPGLISIDHLTGDYGQVGSTYKLKFKMGKRDMEMIETIKVKNFPDLFITTYDIKNVWNEVQTHFEKINDSTTKYWTDNEFEMKGFMKIMAFVMPGVFKKQSQKYLDLFKEFVEKETNQ